MDRLLLATVLALLMGACISSPPPEAEWNGKPDPRASYDLVAGVFSIRVSGNGSVAHAKLGTVEALLSRDKCTPPPFARPASHADRKSATIALEGGRGSQRVDWTLSAAASPGNEFAFWLEVRATSGNHLPATSTVCSTWQAQVVG